MTLEARHFTNAYVRSYLKIRWKYSYPDFLNSFLDQSRFATKAMLVNQIRILMVKCNQLTTKTEKNKQ